MKINGNIDIPDQALAGFCRKWKITEVALFGSVLRQDFRPDSDVDMLVTFEEGAPWGLWDLFDMGEQMAAILGRRVDLVEKEAVERSENPFRKRSILKEAQVVYTLE